MQIICNQIKNMMYSAEKYRGTFGGQNVFDILQDHLSTKGKVREFLVKISNLTFSVIFLLETYSCGTLVRAIRYNS